jgi:N-acetylated-alpha-linked acidic dipeptidase
MRKFCKFFGIFLSLTIPFTAGAQKIGLHRRAAKQQTELESKFDALLQAKNIDQNNKYMSARPHHVGSPYGKEVADFIAALKSYGFETEIETFYTLFHPKERVLEMVSPPLIKAILQEPVLKEDATSGQTKEQLPTYNCWSADGDVTGDLVFVNFGLPEDYEVLERMGIDVKGKLRSRNMADPGGGLSRKWLRSMALSDVSFTDPMEDGYFQGDVYPKGAFKNELETAGISHGYACLLWRSIHSRIRINERCKRLTHQEAPNLLKIPVLPISYHGCGALTACWKDRLHLSRGEERYHLLIILVRARPGFI